MFPVLFRIGSFEVTSFGVLVAMGVIAALWLLRRELRWSGLDHEAGVDAGLVAVVGGLVGSKLLFALEHADEPLRATLLARGGLSWFGGLLGGFLAGGVMVVRGGLPLWPMVAAAAPAVALGHAIGRIGCFLVGDDYGRPSRLPWAVAFPEGFPPTDARVHPTQLYESFPLAALAFLLVRWRRAGVGDREIIARYLLIAGSLRFAIEFVRVNRPVFLGLTTAHLLSAAAVVAGLLVLAASSKSGRQVTPTA